MIPKTTPGRPRDPQSTHFRKMDIICYLLVRPRGPKGDHKSYQNQEKTVWERTFQHRTKQQNPDRVFLVFEALRGGPGTRKYSENGILSFKIAGPMF